MAREADRLDEAVSLYRKAVDLRPSWAEGWWYLGTIAFDRQEFSEAAADLTKVTNLAPDHSNAFAMLGLSEAKLDRAQPAIEHLTKALKLGISNEANLQQVVLLTEGTLLLGAGSFASAQEALDELVRTGASADSSLLTALGESVLGIAPAKEPAATENTDLVLSAGHAEMLAAYRDQIREAHDAYTELAKQYPKTHNVQFALGRFLLTNHLDDEAVTAFQREIENSPQHLLARLGIAGILVRSDPEKGLPYAEEAAKLAPKLAEAHFLLGASRLGVGDAEHALPELERARQLAPNDARVYFELSKVYSRLHRETDAAEARKKFHELSPQ